MSQRPPGSLKSVCKIALVQPRRLRLERLEPRALLATDLGEIRGVVFIDRLSDGFTNDDQLVSAATIDLFLDDGDGLFEPGGDDLLQAASTTDNAGGYAFQRLSAEDFWVSQPAQTVAGRSLLAQQTLLTISALEAQGDVGLLVDSFDTAAPLSIAANGSTGANNASTAVVKTSKNASTHMWITAQRQKSATTKLVCGVATNPETNSTDPANIRPRRRRVTSASIRSAPESPVA